MNSSRIIIPLLTASILVTQAEDSPEDKNRSRGKFGGPDAPEVYLDEIRKRQKSTGPDYLLPWWDRAMEPWLKFKGDLEDSSNLRFGGHIQMNYQKASSTLEDPDYGYGALLRMTGIWTPGGRENPDAGSLTATLDYRTALGNGVPPSNLGGQFGYVGTTNAILGDTGWDLAEFYWAQPYRNGTSGFAIGRMDPNNFFYTHGFSSPWSGFMNNEVVNPTHVLQPQTSWGIILGHYFSENVYGVAGFFDANGSASDNLEWFSGGSEFWSGLELGWVPSQEERLEKKISLSIWNVDEREDAGFGRGHGITATASWTFGEFNPFTRVGWSDGTAAQYEKSFLTGFRYKFREGADIFGMAFSVGDSSQGLGSQNAFEIFYNYGLAENLALTFDIQRIGNPLLNPEKDEVWLFGTRLRATF